MHTHVCLTCDTYHWLDQVNGTLLMKARRISCQTFLHISLVQEHFHVAARFCKCIHMFAWHVTRIIGLIRWMERCWCRRWKFPLLCLCYSVFCDLDVKNRSCIARKEMFLFWWSFLGQSRQKPQNSDPKDLSHLHVMFSIMCLPLWHCYVTIQILCQVLNLWSGTYTWCSVSCACHYPLLLASCLTQFSSRKPLDTSHSVRY